MDDAPLHYIGDGLTIDETAPLFSVLRLRGATPIVFERLSSAFDCDWPRAPNTCSGGVCWLGPGEWAILDRDPHKIDKQAIVACAGALYHVAHLGEAKRRWRLTGARAADVLARGTSIDVHPRAFPPGACAQTRFAEIGALIVRPASEAAFDLFADAAAAAYLRLWLQTAARHAGA